MASFAWFYRLTTSPTAARTPYSVYQLPDNDEEYEPPSQSEGGESEYTTWSAMPTENSGARAMYYYAARQQKWGLHEPRPWPFDAFLGVSSSCITSSPNGSIVGLPDDFWELWDPYQDDHKQHPDLGFLRKPPTIRWVIVKGVCNAIVYPSFFLSLFKKTPEEYMSNNPWWTYPHVEYIKDINLPEDRR